MVIFALLLSAVPLRQHGAACAGQRSAAEKPPYTLADPALAAVLIDRSVDQSFVAVRCDTQGRLFVGGRESLWVYEPNRQGGYRSPQQLYRFPAESWIFDIEVRGHDLYVATASAIYRLPQAAVRRGDLEVKRLISGQPLGHLQLGFFGLAWGPEGDLYFSLGDPLQHYGDFNRPDHWGHWTFLCQPEGTRVPYTGVGGVFRCRPDGSGLQIVSGGIFRSCGLAFDRHWNLFTDDNDREAMPYQYVPARLLHVAPQADFSWPRGWMASKSPGRADLLETVFEGLGREAPVGLAYYDEEFFPESYRGQLYLARWAQRVITRHTLRPRGASFSADEQPFLRGGDTTRPAGICVGRGGRLFVTLLDMAQLESSPTCPSDLVMITRADDTAGQPFDGYEAVEASENLLWEELSSRSWSRRHRAHQELLRRGKSLLDEAADRLVRAAPSDPAIHHLPWLAAAGRSERARHRLAGLIKHPEPAVRLQAIRALDEMTDDSGVDKAEAGLQDEVFAPALSDGNAQVAHAAVAAFFHHGTQLPQAIVRHAASQHDSYLRQSAALLLAERSSAAALDALCRHEDSTIRLAGVLATGFRLTRPRTLGPLPEDLPLTPFPESACVVRFADATVDLREMGPIGQFTTAEHWNAGRHAEEQDRLFDILSAALEDSEEKVRLQAAHFLMLLNDPRSQGRVVEVVTANEQARLAAVPAAEIRTVSQAWVAGPFPDTPAGLGGSHPPEEGPIELSAAYPAGGAEVRWKPVTASYFDFTRLLAAGSDCSCYAYCRLESGARQRILLFVGSNDGVKLWHNGQEVWRNETVRPALAFQDALLLDLQPGSNDLLVRVRNETGDTGLLLHFKALGEVLPTMPEPLDAGALADRLRSSAVAGQPEAIPAEFLETDWKTAVARGDPRRGRRLFGRDGLACGNCHAINSEQSVAGGPSLADAAKRFTLPHLVESILLPSRNVSPVFQATRLITRDGRQFSGLVLAESADELRLLLPDTSHKSFATSEIETRTLEAVSPMPHGIVKSPHELQDLLAYLLSDNPQPP